MPEVIGPAIAREPGVALPMVMAGPTIMLVVMGIAHAPLSNSRAGAQHNGIAREADRDLLLCAATPARHGGSHLRGLGRRAAMPPQKMKSLASMCVVFQPLRVMVLPPKKICTPPAML